MGVLDLLNAATPSTSQVKICMDGEKKGEWDNLVNSLEDTALSATSLAAEETAAKIDRMEALREEIAKSEVTFDMRQMDWTARVALAAKHPPRPGFFIDKIRGVNITTYSREIIPRSCIAVTDGTGDRETKIPIGTWTHLLGRGEEGDPDFISGALNAGQVEELFAAAVDVNDKGTQVPPSARSSFTNQDSGTSSNPSEPGPDHPRSGGAAGSRRTSPKSSTRKRAAKKTAPSLATPSDT